MKKLVVTVILLLALIPITYLSASSRYISGTAGPNSTVVVKGNNAYQQFNSVYDTKNHVNPYAGWNVSYKAMWSSPTAYMVTSSGSRMSNSVSLNGKGYYYGGNNAGQVGQKYYTKVKPSASQIGDDAITLSLQSDG